MRLYAPLETLFVTSPFGMRNGSMHNGTDFRAAVNTPIYAPADGRVTSMYSSHRGGKQLIIEHTQLNKRTGYAHLNGYVKKIGETVKAGELIAYSGNTGVGTGPHLHFTVTDTVSNKKLDPMTVIEDNKKSYGQGNPKQLIIGLLLAISTLVILTIIYNRNND